MSGRRANSQRECVTAEESPRPVTGQAHLPGPGGCPFRANVEGNTTRYVSHMCLRRNLPEQPFFCGIYETSALITGALIASIIE